MPDSIYNIPEEVIDSLRKAALLIAKEKVSELTASEHSELDAWLREDSKHGEWFSDLSNHQYLWEELRLYERSQQRAASSLQQLLGKGLTPLGAATSSPVHRVHFLKTAWFRYAAAIAILIIGITVYYTFSHTPPPENKVAQTTPPSVPNDVMPGSDRAVLILSTGEQVKLDSNASATITDGSLSIENRHGHLSYKDAQVVAINTMTTPKGGQYQLTLADGTKVWLNAASSITYPTAFPNNTREVTITGEAYFEVSKNKEKSFIVKTATDEIKVLGTSFNVNTYEDKPGVKTSLLEGSVKIGDTFIKPGQAYQNGRIIPTDVQQDVAWKNGVFVFGGSDIKEIMKQVERWYDVKVEYVGTPPSMKINGKMDRGVKLSGLMHFWAEYGIHTRLEGRMLVIGKK